MISVRFQRLFNWLTDWSADRLFRLIVVLLIVYSLFSVGVQIRRVVGAKKKEKELRVEIALVSAENDRLRRRIEYYQTETFKEKEARLKLGYKRPGETAVVLPETRRQRDYDPVLETTTEFETDKRENWERWLDYFF